MEDESEGLSCCRAFVSFTVYPQNLAQGLACNRCSINISCRLTNRDQQMESTVDKGGWALTVLCVTLKQSRENGPFWGWEFLTLLCRVCSLLIRTASRTFKKNASAQLVPWENFGVRISGGGTQHVFLKIAPQLRLICLEGWEAQLQPVERITPSIIYWVPTVCQAK